MQRVQDDRAAGERALDETFDNLSCRFAYKSDAPPPPQLPRTPTDSVHPGPSRPVVPASNCPQLAQLSKCIACGIQWTSRKTAKQKRTHIDQCAKKYGLTKDTTRTLVNKEIAPHKNATVTLMGSVISTCLAKKSRRQQVVSTVRSLPETRESILDRARDILGSADGDRTNLQPTQQFARSELACQNAQKPNFSGEEPPPTQAFGASSLCRVAVAKRFGCFSEESSFLPTQPFGTSMFTQGSHKRRASPSPPLDSESRSVRRRLFSADICM